MKRGKTVGKEECEGVLSLREAIRTIKTAILKIRYMAARQANLEHLKLYFNVGAYVSANSRDAHGTPPRLKRFQRSWRGNCLDCGDFRRLT